MPWVGRFTKDFDRSVNSKIGVGYADWYETDTLICTYTRRIDGQADAVSFKQDAIAYRNKYIAVADKNTELADSLTTFLNT